MSAKPPGRLTNALYRYRTEGSSPIRQAAAIGLGLYIGCSPFIGFHLLLALALGRLFRLNRLKVYIAANISNPLVAPFLYATEIQIGARLRTGHFYSVARLDDIQLKGLTLDVLLGSVIVGAALGIAGAVATYLVVRSRGDDPQTSELVEATAERYLPAGCAAWEFSRSKLRMDPIYLQILRDGVLPDAGVILDAGCGRGLMLALIVEARERFQRGLWPAGWPAPPVDARLHGLELRERMVRRAQDVVGTGAVVSAGDLSDGTLPPCRAVLVFDVLHLLPKEAQDRLLAQVGATLEPGGVFIMRDADADGGWRFQAVRLGNRFNAVLQGRPRRRFAFDSARGWQARLERLGFSIEKLHRQEDGPFANFSMYARYRPPCADQNG